MYADRYARRRFEPGSLGVAVAINAAVVAALITSAPRIIPIRLPGPLETFNVPIPPPPPPLPPEPHRTLPRTTAEPHPFTPRPIADLPIEPLPPVGPIDIGPIGGGIEGGAGVAPPPAPPPPPALVDAQPDPRYAGDFQPDYPPSERRQGNSGRVVVRVLIGIDGRVHAVEPVSTTSDAFLDETRRRALARWRFRPAARGGIPEESWRVMTVRFVLSQLD